MTSSQITAAEEFIRYLREMPDAKEALKYVVKDLLSRSEKPLDLHHAAAKFLGEFTEFAEKKNFLAPKGSYYENRQVFLVAMKVESRLGREVVSNYVKLALRNYEKLHVKSGGEPYFHGISYGVGFHVQDLWHSRNEWDLSKETALQESVKMIAQIQKKQELFWEEIDHRSR